MKEEEELAASFERGKISAIVEERDKLKERVKELEAGLKEAIEELEDVCIYDRGYRETVARLKLKKLLPEEKSK